MSCRCTITPRRVLNVDVLNHAYPALEELRTQGVVTAIGAGMNTVGPLMQVARQTNMDIFMVAGRYTAGTGASRRRRPSSFKASQSAAGICSEPSLVLRTTCSDE